MRKGRTSTTLRPSACTLHCCHSCLSSFHPARRRFGRNEAYWLHLSLSPHPTPLHTLASHLDVLRNCTLDCSLGRLIRSSWLHSRQDDMMALDAELQDVLLRHCSSLGSSFVAKGSSRVQAQPSNRMLFAKTGAIDQVLGEAGSLDAMYRASVAAGHRQTLIPTIHAFGKTADERKAFLVTDYKDLSSGLSRSSQRTLGEKLAQMHLNGTSENGMYGFGRPTHCGATVSSQSVEIPGHDTAWWATRAGRAAELSARGRSDKRSGIRRS